MVHFQIPHGLPGGKYVKLTSSDKARILRIMDNKLGESAVRRQRLNKTTNRCEAANVTVLKSVPKSRTFRRNFHARANSACHSLSLGQCRSTANANDYLGASNSSEAKAHSARLVMQGREQYHRIRKKSNGYKAGSKRHRVLHHRCQAKDAKHSYATGCQDPVVKQEHSYDFP